MISRSIPSVSIIRFSATGLCSVRENRRFQLPHTLKIDPEVVSVEDLELANYCPCQKTIRHLDQQRYKDTNSL